MFWFVFTELPGVMPEGVVGLTANQIVASQRAAVRMERNLDIAKDRKLSKSEYCCFYCLFVFFSVLFLSFRIVSLAIACLFRLLFYTVSFFLYKSCVLFRTR